jgi:hypothetical protein
MEKIHGNPMGSAGKAYENPGKHGKNLWKLWKTMKLMEIQ